MTMPEAIRVGFTNSFNHTGRASRSEFWWFWTFHFIVPVALVFLLAPIASGVSYGLAETLAGVGFLLYLITIPGVFTGMIRRQHDIGKPGKLAAIVYALVLIIAVITFVYLMTLIPFTGNGPVTGALLDGVDQNPAILLVTGPMILMFGFIELIMFVIIAGMILMTVGIPLLMALLTLAIGLARPSDPKDNAYGPKPAEVSL